MALYFKMGLYGTVQPNNRVALGRYNAITGYGFVNRCSYPVCLHYRDWTGYETAISSFGSLIVWEPSDRNMELVT